ncbi:unnamed protein product [Boreogadus saida]
MWRAGTGVILRQSPDRVEGKGNIQPSPHAVDMSDMKHYHSEQRSIACSSLGHLINGGKMLAGVPLCFVPLDPGMNPVIGLTAHPCEFEAWGVPGVNVGRLALGSA